MSMSREEMIKELDGVTKENVVRYKTKLWSVADALGLKFKRTACPRCTRDLLAIVQEELGIIENAAEVSEFN